MPLIDRRRLKLTFTKFLRALISAFVGSTCLCPWFGELVRMVNASSDKNSLLNFLWTLWKTQLLNLHFLHLDYCNIKWYPNCLVGTESKSSIRYWHTNYVIAVEQSITYENASQALKEKQKQYFFWFVFIPEEQNFFLSEVLEQSVFLSSLFPIPLQMSKNCSKVLSQWFSSHDINSSQVVHQTLFLSLYLWPWKKLLSSSERCSGA